MKKEVNAAHFRKSRISALCVVLVAFMSVFQAGLYAQSAVLSPKSFRVIMKVASNDTTIHKGDTAFKTNTKLNGSAIIVLNDTLQVYKIHLKLGTTDSTFNLLSKSFLYSQQGNFNDGTSFSRNGKVIRIGMGDFYGINKFYAEVKIENTLGGYSPVLKFKNR